MSFSAPHSSGKDHRIENPRPSPRDARNVYIALTGNPNCGKTTLFNALTGLRAKVGNYAGVTVERKEGKLIGAPVGMTIRVLDLPGTYSLSPQSLDEQVSRDVLLNRLPEVPPPHLIVVVVDASNLQRNLYYATQVIELGHPTIIALNMVDIAEANGHQIHTDKLSEILGVPVLPVVASSGQGIKELRDRILATVQSAREITPRQFCQFPGPFRIEATKLADLLAETFKERRVQATSEALLILSNERALASSAAHYPQRIQDAVAAARHRLDAQGVDWRGAPIEWRYARVAEIQQAVTTELSPPGETTSDRIDRVVTHKLWGTVIFLAIMAVMFQSIFSFAEVPMNWLESGVAWAGDQIGALMPPGDLRDLLVNGVIAGVGAVVVFLPQILLLFFFIGLLEDTGYMARAAFLMDRLMSRVGLHGKSFIPMLSSFACAIPGIMATRTIENPKDRLVTILVAPLMSCSARLPVYTLLIGACIPDRVLGDLNYELNLGFTRFNVFGFLGLRGLTMLAMYLLGIVVALLMAWLFKKTLLKGETPMLIMELPPYKRPLLRVVLRHIWDRSKLFLTRAGTVILGISIVLWFLATYPRSSNLEAQYETRRAEITNSFSAVSLPTAVGAEANQLAAMQDQLEAVDKEEAGEKLRRSFAGMAGRAIEPLIAPLGFDWKIGIGIVASFAAREVFVSTMSTVYNVGELDDSDAGLKTLEQTLQEQQHPDGTYVYTTLTAVTLMVFYVFAMQCVSTVAVVRRETNSWKWPFFQWLYMGVLAWVLAFFTYHGGRWLGLE
ncbi:MAG: ferrous iron transport protein B [Verrucomicrobiae bacterium]|nr:ferrous iron transport protein B [Verrucomicrobiae bacterium]